MQRRLPVLPLAEADPRDGAAESETDAREPPARPLPELPLRPVRRLRRPSVATFRRFARSGTPLVLEGAFECPAVGGWTPEHLRERAGDVRARAYVQPAGHIHLDARRGFELVETSLGAYADRVIGGQAPTHYFRAPIGQLPAVLRDELIEPSYVRGAARLRKNLWFSADGTVSRLHFDLPHNLIAQLTGAKRFLLYPAREYFKLYPFAPWSSLPHLSRVDLGAPDFRRYPRLPLARGWHCDLREGDMLLMPSRMWHYAESLGASVTVNHWWPSLAMLPLAIASDLYKRARGLNI